MDYSKLTSLQLDAIKEVTNIGTGNAATALSQLLNRKVDIDVPSVNIVPFSDVIDSFGENVVVGVIVRVLGDAPGNILFICEYDTAQKFIKLLTGREEDVISEMGTSVMGEIGNIVCSSYMNAISMFTNLSMMPSVPAVAYDMISAIISTGFIESGQYFDYVLDIETVFFGNESDGDGHFYYIPMPGSLEKILNALGVN